MDWAKDVPITCNVLGEVNTHNLCLAIVKDGDSYYINASDLGYLEWDNSDFK